MRLARGHSRHRDWADRVAPPATSHFRFPDPLQSPGSGSGKPIKFRDQSTIRQRDHAHQQRSRPIVEALQTWLKATQARVSNASPLADAIGYTLRHWSGLVLFLDDGRLEIDTNVVERGMKGVAVARKNALFSGSDGAAEHWAIALTLIGTAKLNGVEPLAWLTDVLERLVSGSTKSHQLEQLLPWNWRPPDAVDAIPVAEAA